MGCISPSQNISVIPPYDNAQNAIVIEEIGTNNTCSSIDESDNEVSASEPETSRTGRLTIGPITSNPNHTQIKTNNHNLPRKLSISITNILNASKKFKNKTKSNSPTNIDIQPSNTSISFEKQPKYHRNGIYDKSSSESEIKEASATTLTNSKPKHRSKTKPYHTYKCSTSDASITDIKDEDSDLYNHNDFESITELTNFGNETIDHDTTKTNNGSVTDAMSQLSREPKISPRMSLKLKQLTPTIVIEPKYNPISKHYNAKWNVKNPFYHSDDGNYDGDDTCEETCDESYVSELSSVKSVNNFNFYQSFKSKSNNSNKSIMEIKPHRMGDKIKMKLQKTKVKSKTYSNQNTVNNSNDNTQFHRIKQLPVKSPKRYNNRKKSHVSSSYGTYNSLQAHQSSSVIDRCSIKDRINNELDTTNDESTGNESTSSNEFEDDAPVHLPYNSVRLSNITNETTTTDGQPPPLPVKFLQTDSNKQSQFYQYTHYNYYYFDQDEKQKCHQIPLQRPCPPPHSFNAYSTKDSTTHNTRHNTIHTLTPDDNNGWTSDNSTHV